MKISVENIAEKLFDLAFTGVGMLFIAPKPLKILLGLIIVEIIILIIM